MFPRASVLTPYQLSSGAFVIQLRLFTQFSPSVSRKTVRNTARGPSSTVTVAAAVSASTEARTVAVPASRPVTSPSSEICAMRLSLLDQATATSVMARPCWSLTVAVSWDVSPASARTADAGEISIVVAAGGSVPHPPPSPRARAASANAPRGFREEIRTAGFILPLLVARCSARWAMHPRRPLRLTRPRCKVYITLCNVCYTPAGSTPGRGSQSVDAARSSLVALPATCRWNPLGLSPLAGFRSGPGAMPQDCRSHSATPCSASPQPPSSSRS